MSSLSASLCLFSAALCNVAVLDQNLFEGGNQQAQPQQQPGYGSGQLINQAANIFGSFANQAGFGNQQGNKQGQGQGQGQGNNKNPRPPHQSPCGKKFQYVTDGRQWKGILRLKNVDVNHDTTLEVELVVPQQGNRRVSPCLKKVRRFDIPIS